jgi:cell wall-associated NlpC family hydrolase
LSWLLVNQSLADLMCQPAVSAERSSQILLGEAARLLGRREEWAEIRLERDGYAGWARDTALLECTEERARTYTSASQTVVTGEIAQAFIDPARRANAGKLPCGIRLPSVERRDDLVALELPDGRRWWVAESDTRAATELPRPDPEGIAVALRWMRRHIGVPYLWGGCSPYGYDCSGLTQAFWSLLGVRIPRDADQQFQAGVAVEGPPLPGDLLFFSLNASGAERSRHADVRHVGIALGGHEMLHASGKARAVAVDELGTGRSAYGDWLYDNLAGVRRFACG